MSELVLRPRFQAHLPDDPASVLSLLEERLTQPDAKATGIVIEHHVMIKVPIGDRHYWSPQLDLEVEAHPEGGTLIRGLIGPSPGVWTKFIFLYAAIGFAALIGIMIALSQWTLNKPLYGLWLLGISAIGIVLVYVMGQTGKRLGHDQTWQLRYFLDESLNRTVATQGTAKA